MKSHYKNTLSKPQVATRLLNFLKPGLLVGIIATWGLSAFSINQPTKGLTDNLFTKEVSAQQKRTNTLTGLIKDMNGNTLAGASIQVKDATIGTLTDADGRYTLYLTPNKEAVLVFSFLGKQTKEILYTGQAQLIVTLEDTPESQKTIIEIGSFDRPRNSFSGAVTTVCNKELDMFRGQNLLFTLRNIDPSFRISPNNEEGSNPNNIPNTSIRGGSVSATDNNAFMSTPLVIMNGLEVTLLRLMDYNVDDIESIYIFKDASATALYGARGGNGVIVITSKEADPNKLKVRIRAGLDLEMADLSSYSLPKASESLQKEWDNGYFTSSDPAIDELLKKHYQEILQDVNAGANTNWLKEPLHTGLSQNYQARIESGHGAFRWSASASYNSLAGAMKDSKRENFSGQVLLAYHFRDIILRNQTSISHNEAKNSRYGSLASYAKMPPYLRTHDKNGELIKAYSHPTKSETINPLYFATLAPISKSDYTDISNDFSIEWEIIDGLSAKGQFGIAKLKGSIDELSPNLYGNSHTLQLIPKQDYYSFGNGENLKYDVNLLLTYAKLFNGKHQLHAGLISSFIWNDGTSNSSKGIKDRKEKSTEGTQPQQNDTSIESMFKSHMMGYGLSAGYLFDKRYFVDGTLRIDGISYGDSKKDFNTFWSAGIGWNIHQERFLANSSTVSNLRLKASYGEVGSQSTTSNLLLYSLYYNQRNLEDINISLLKPLKTKQFNIGMELGLFDNRLTASFDYYTKKIPDILFNTLVPSDYTLEIIGDGKSKGFEAGLGAYLIRDTERQLAWTVNAKLAYNKNEVSIISNESNEPNTDPGTGIPGFPSKPIDPETGLEYDPNQSGNKPGIKENISWSNEPLYMGNLSTMVSWQNLSFNISFGYYWGGEVYNAPLTDQIVGSKQNNIPTPRRFLEEERVFELQSANIQYLWESKWLTNYSISSVTFALHFSDLFHSSSLSRERGLNYPFARRMGASVAVVF